MTVTPGCPKIRNVLATPAGQWVCQPIELGSDDRICAGCRKQRLEPFATAGAVLSVPMNPGRVF
jgi:hypothetical protein